MMCDITVVVSSTTQKCPTYKRTNPSNPQRPLRQTLLKPGYHICACAKPLPGCVQKKPGHSEHHQTRQFVRTLSKRNYASSTWLVLILVVLVVLSTADTVGFAREDGSVDAVSATLASKSTAMVEPETLLQTELVTITGLMPQTDSLEGTTATSPASHTFSLAYCSSPTLEDMSMSPISVASYMPTGTSSCSTSPNAQSTTAPSSLAPFVFSRHVMTTTVAATEFDVDTSASSRATQTPVESCLDVITESSIIRETVTVTVAPTADTTGLNTTTLHFSTTVVATVLTTAPPSSSSNRTLSNASSPSNMNQSPTQSVDDIIIPPISSKLAVVPPNTPPSTTTTSTTSTASASPTSQPPPSSTGYSTVPMLAPLPFTSPPAVTSPASSTTVTPWALADHSHAITSPSTGTDSAQTRVIPVTTSANQNPVEPSNTAKTTTPSSTPAPVKERDQAATSSTSPTESTPSLLEAPATETPHPPTSSSSLLLPNSAPRSNSPVQNVVTRVKIGATATKTWLHSALCTWIGYLGIHGPPPAAGGMGVLYTNGGGWGWGRDLCFGEVMMLRGFGLACTGVWVGLGFSHRRARSSGDGKGVCLVVGRLWAGRYMHVCVAGSLKLGR